MVSSLLPLVVGVTGASGAVYAVRLLDVLLSAGRDVHLSISPAGAAVLAQELELAVDLDDFRLRDLLPESEAAVGEARFAVLRSWLGGRGLLSPRTDPAVRGTVAYHHYQDLLAPMASGSARTGGMVICPCSSGSLAAVAHATSGNLIQRAADVHLKERRKLILVPRETPLSEIQLDNMRRSARAGAVVLPAMPGWYHDVRHLGDLVDFVVARICDQLDVEHSLMKRWGQVGGT